MSEKKGWWDSSELDAEMSKDDSLMDEKFDESIGAELARLHGIKVDSLENAAHGDENDDSLKSYVIRGFLLVLLGLFWWLRPEGGWQYL